jgi:hypothetical protein
MIDQACMRAINARIGAPPTEPGGEWSGQKAPNIMIRSRDPHDASALPIEVLWSTDSANGT